MAGKKKTERTWVYPLDGSAGKIIDHEKGADCPEGFSFQPVTIEDVEQSDTPDVPDAGEVADLEDAVAEAETTIADLKKEAKANKAELKKVKAKIKELDGIIEERDNELTELQARIDELEAENADKSKPENNVEEPSLVKPLTDKSGEDE